MTNDTHRPSPLSLALVAAQMILIALIASPVAGLVPGTLLELIGLAMLLAGVVMAGIAFIDMRKTRFSVLPEPKLGGQMVREGLYQRIRHPMYSAVMLCAIGACFAHSDGRHVLLTLALFAVLAAKIVREERFLMAAYPGYESYRREVKAVIPGII